MPGGGACSTCPDLQWKVYAVSTIRCQMHHHLSRKSYCGRSLNLLAVLGHGSWFLCSVIRSLQYPVSGKSHDSPTVKNCNSEEQLDKLELSQFLTDTQTPSMGRRYFQDLPTFMKENVRPGILPLNYEAAIISSLLVGAIIGSVTGGALADVYGRKFIFEGACYIMILFAFLSSYSFGASGAAVVGTLSFWRFFLGMGIGAMYPVSAIIMSEYSTRKSRGAFVAIVFAMQGMITFTSKNFLTHSFHIEKLLNTSADSNH